jgi:hypothetical protein
MIASAVLFPELPSGSSLSFMVVPLGIIDDLGLCIVHSRGVTRRRPVRYQPSKASITWLKNRGGRKP